MSTAFNPFALYLDPTAMLQAHARAGESRAIQRRVCRPLDKPLLARTVEQARYDETLDAEDVPASDADALLHYC